MQKHDEAPKPTARDRRDELLELLGEVMKAQESKFRRAQGEGSNA